MPVSQLQQGTRYLTSRGSTTTIATGATAAFTIVGTVIVHALELEITAAVQAQTTNLKWIANPTVGSDTDICAVVDFNAAAVGTHGNTTGTFATAMVKSANGAHVHQAAPTVLTAGTLDLSSSAASTGAYKCSMIWEPLTPNASVRAIAPA